ncbi:MAG: STY0301 family protein [Alphaproteobacteria bacterium]
MKWSFVPLALAVASPALAAEIEVGTDNLCPHAIDTEQRAVNVPPDFQPGSYPGIYVLQDVTFSDGQPGAGAMEPQEVKGASGSVITKTYFFPKKKDRRPIYFNCMYDNTTVTLAQQIGRDIAKCVVTYNAEIRVGGYPQVTSSYCTNSYDIF